VKSKNLRLGDGVLKGYARAEFEDLWVRYLPAESATSSQPFATAATSATSAIAEVGAPESVADFGNVAADLRRVADVADVADVAGFPEGVLAS
jgi:hypothetical protein